MTTRPLGVKLKYFKRLVDDCGGRNVLEGKTTAQVCLEYIVPLTSRCQLSLVEHLAQCADENHYIGEANWYVSHAWQYLFLETMDSLEEFFQHQGITDTAVVWFCLFNNNQHLAHTYPFEWWSTTFKSVLASIGNVVMIMHPWDNPVVLRRSWCVFEVYVAITVGARFEMAMAPAQLKLLLDDMLDGNAFSNMLGKIKSENSQTTVPSDRDGIFNIIRTEVSFEQLDRLVFSTISDWMKRTLENHIHSIPSQLEQADSYDRLRNIYFAEKKWADAQFCLEQSCQLYTQCLGEHHEKTFAARSNLYYCYAENEQPPSTWRPLFEQLIQEQTCMFGRFSLQVADTLKNFASAFYVVHERDLALELYLEVYEIQEATLGPEAPKTIDTSGRVGIVYYTLRKFTEAESWLKMSYDNSQRIVGQDHPTTTFARKVLAMLYHIQGQWKEALPIMEEELRYATRVYEPTHDRTLRALGDLGVTYYLVSDFEQAEKHLLLLLDLVKQLPEAPQPLTIVAFGNLGILSWAKRDYATALSQIEEYFDWCMDNCPPRHTDTTQAAGRLYRFLLDSKLMETNPDIQAWTKVTKYFSEPLDDAETWHDDQCHSCNEFIIGTWYECPECADIRYNFCRQCYQAGKMHAHCHHAQDHPISYKPPRRYFLEQQLHSVPSPLNNSHNNFTIYSSYCEMYQVPLSERLTLPIST